MFAGGFSREMDELQVIFCPALIALSILEETVSIGVVYVTLSPGCCLDYTLSFHFVAIKMKLTF